MWPALAAEVVKNWRAKGQLFKSLETTECGYPRGNILVGIPLPTIPGSVVRAIWVKVARERICPQIDARNKRGKVLNALF